MRDGVRDREFGVDPLKAWAILAGAGEAFADELTAWAESDEGRQGVRIVRLARVPSRAIGGRAGACGERRLDAVAVAAVAVAAVAPGFTANIEALVVKSVGGLVVEHLIGAWAIDTGEHAAVAERAGPEV